MALLPSDQKLLGEIYQRYRDVFASFSREEPPRATKNFVPIDIAAIAGRFDVDHDIIFGRLYFHLEEKYGYSRPDGTKVSFFSLRIGPDKHCVNFPLLAAVLAGLQEENRRHVSVFAISVASLVVSIVALAFSVAANRG